MNIICCVKEVVDTTAEKKLDAAFRLDRKNVDNILNPFDEYAVEEALKAREAHGGQVTLLCMGRPEAQPALRKGLAMGADKAVLITDPALAGTDAWGTAFVLAQALTKLEPWDAVLFGQQATDARGGQVPETVAAFLHLPGLMYAARVETLGGEPNTARILRQTETGFDVVEAALPAVLMVTKSCNEPRFPSLRGINAAKKKEIALWSLADLGIAADRVGAAGAKTKVLSAAKPAPRAAGVLVKDDPDPAQRIVEFLQARRVL